MRLPPVVYFGETDGYVRPQAKKDCLELRVWNSCKALGLIQKIFLLAQDIITYGSLLFLYSVHVDS